MSDSVNAIFVNYSLKLERASAVLDPEGRSELLSGISEYFDAARKAGEADDAPAALMLIDRIGEPEVLVSAALESAINPALSSNLIRNSASSEVRHTNNRVKVLLWLTIGSFVPFIGWLWGVAMVWKSDRWSRASKVVVVAVVPGGPLGALLLTLWLGGLTQQICSSGDSSTTDGLNGPVTSFVTNPTSCTHPSFTPWIGLALAAALLIGSVVGPLYVYRHRLAPGDSALLHPWPSRTAA
jgi:hypothetical protein